jgi:hypothetical protein
MSKRCLVCDRTCTFKLVLQGEGTGYECQACGRYRSNLDNPGALLAELAKATRYNISRDIRRRNKSGASTDWLPPRLEDHYLPQGYLNLLPPPTDPLEKLDQLVLEFAQESPELGCSVIPFNFAWEWCALLLTDEPGNLESFVSAMGELGYLPHVPSGRTVHLNYRYTLSTRGWSRVRELRKTSPTLSNRVFCAFPNRNTNSEEDRIISQQSTDLFAAIQVPVQPLIPYRVEADHQATQINDAIVAGLRGARFVIADLSHHRPNVYYEAGFAQGLGTPVVFICRSDLRRDTHFDVASHRILEWSPDTLPAFAQELKVHLQARALLP